jgi:signal transduction histidine kinase
VRHASATRVVVRTGRRPGDDGRPGIFVEVCDDGCGIDPARIGRPGSRGLRHMRERAARLSGSLRIEAAEPHTGAGARVELWLPESAPPRGATPPP